VISILKEGWLVYILVTLLDNLLIHGHDIDELSFFHIGSLPDPEVTILICHLLLPYQTIHKDYSSSQQQIDPHHPSSWHQSLLYCENTYPNQPNSHPASHYM